MRIKTFFRENVCFVNFTVLLELFLHGAKYLIIAIRIFLRGCILQYETDSLYLDSSYCTRKIRKLLKLSHFHDNIHADQKDSAKRITFRVEKENKTFPSINNDYCSLKCK